MADRKIPVKSKATVKAAAQSPVAVTAVVKPPVAKAAVVPAAPVVQAAKPSPVAKPAPAEKPAPEKPVVAERPVAVARVAKVAPVAEVKPALSMAAPKPAEIASAKVPAEIFNVNTTQSGAKIMNDTIQKTQEATKQVAEKATEQFRAAANQANERGKVAMEKGARIVEEMADISRGNLEAMVASQKTAAKYAETLSQGAADYSRRSFEEASATLKSFAEVKSPADFFRLQSEYARSAFDQFVAEGSRVTETVVKMSNDVAEPLTSRYAVAAERMKAVAA